MNDAPPPDKAQIRRFDGDGITPFTIVEFEGTLRDQLVADFHRNALATGRFAHGAKLVAPQTAKSLALAGASIGVTVASAVLGPQLFMATADPATLMQIGNGVGSAVMGASGIAGQAPFVAVPSTLPVLAPLLVMQALNTAMIMQEFQRIDRKLDVIQRTLDSLLARSEATHIGELLASSSIADEVFQQYQQNGRFSTDMLIRLSTAESAVRALSNRFRQLVEVGVLDETADVLRVNADAHAAMLASFVELRIANLRVGVDLQENPQSVQLSTELLKARIDDALSFWKTLVRRPEVQDEAIRAIEHELAQLNLLERTLPGGERGELEKRLRKLKSDQTETLKSERTMVEQFHALIESTTAAREKLDEPGEMTATLVYWHDETGEHAFVTDQKLLES